MVRFSDIYKDFFLSTHGTFPVYTDRFSGLPTAIFRSTHYVSPKHYAITVMHFYSSIQRKTSLTVYTYFMFI